MNITTVSSNLDWKTNNKGTWKALIKDLEPNGTITFSEGYTAAVSGRMVTVSNSTKPVGTVTYATDDTNTVNTGVLYGAGTAYDSVEAVAGDKTVRMGSINLGSLNWNYSSTYDLFYSSAVSGILKSSSVQVICDKYVSTTVYYSSMPDQSIRGFLSFAVAGDLSILIKDTSFGSNNAALKASLSGVILYYELAEPTTSTETPQSLSLTTGNDTLSAPSFDTTYEGTNYSIPLIRNCKYIFRDSEGVDTLIQGTTNNTSVDVTGGVNKLINLTHWFGRSNEPTIAAFYDLYPTWKNYDIPYDQGSTLNYKGTGVQTIGFNAYNYATGTAALLGGNQYQICGTFTSLSYVDVYGATETITLDSANRFTPVNDGILTVTGGNNTDTLVHLCWSGYKNFGEPEYKYEPFISNVKEFPISMYFPQGMNSVFATSNGSSDVSDELTSELKIQRIGVVDLGTFTYNNYTAVSSAYPYGYTQFTFTGKAKGDTNLSCPLFVTSTNTNGVNFSGDKSIIGTASNNTCYIINSDFIGMTGEQIKTALSGVLCYYELATPVVTQLDQPLNLAYPVNDFGTEHSLPQNTTTLITTDLKALIKYNTDYMRMNSQLAEIFPTVKSLVKQEQDGYIMKIDSYAPNARVGAADNLIDKNAEGTPAEFTYRTSGGDVDLTDGTAIAKKSMGTTLNLNQLVAPTNENTVSSTDGKVTITDAVAGNLKHLIVHGDTVVLNQLVKDSIPKTLTATSRLYVEDAAEADLTQLIIFAPTSETVSNVVTPNAVSLSLNKTTTITTPVALYGVGTAKDTYDVLTGLTTHHIAFLDLSTLTFTESSGVYTATIADITPSTANVITDNNYTVVVTGTSVAITASSTPTGNIYYELFGQTYTEGTPTTVTFVEYDNTLFQIDNGPEATFTLTYSGRDQTIELNPYHTYLFNDYGASDSLLTNTSTINAVGGEDMLVDITAFYLGDSDKIANIHSWASLSSRYHQYRHQLPYNPGTLAPLSTAIKVYQEEDAYGIIYNPANSSPSCQRVELHNGVLTDVNFFTSLYVHDKFKRCVMDDLSTRHINYYLDPLDSTKKADGTTSVLTGADGDVMVEIPITYWKVDEDYNGTGKILYLVSDKPFTGSEIHPYFYVSPNGDTPRTQYIGAYQATVCDADGNALNTVDNAYTQISGTSSTRKARSVAGAKPFTSVTLADLRAAAVRNGGTTQNSLFKQYLFLMCAIEGATLNTQWFSPGYSNGKTYTWGIMHCSGRTNFGNGTGQLLAETTSDNDNFYTMKVGSTSVYRDSQQDANGYYSWVGETRTAAATHYWTASPTPSNGDNIYNDHTGTTLNTNKVASYSATADASRVIQCQYRGIENPFGQCWEFEDGIQKYSTAYRITISVNSVIYTRDVLKDGVSPKSDAWTNETNNTTVWTASTTPLSFPAVNAIVYNDAALTVNSGYKVAVGSYGRKACKIWESASISDYTSTAQQGNSNPVYNTERHWWPTTQYTKFFDPCTFLPKVTGGSSATYLCDYFNNDYNANTSCVVFRGGLASYGANAGLGFVYVTNGLTYSYVTISGRLSA